MRSLLNYKNFNNSQRGIGVSNKIKSLKAIKIFSCMILMLFATSCKKYLDVQPEGQLTADKLLVNDAGFQTAMYGVYATMNKKSLYGENLSQNMFEVLAQYFDCPNNTTVANLKTYNYKFAAIDANISSIWADTYNNISNVNNVLINLERFSPDKLQFYNLYKGEALGLRAFMHFDLLRIFGDNIILDPSATGIPYSTDYSLNSPSFVSLAEAYNKIIDDLKNAEQLLSADQQNVTYPKVNSGINYLKDRETHFNLYAVQATLARVYLTKGDNVNALLYAEKVINANKQQLLDKTDVSNNVMRGMIFPKETIFGLYSTSYYTTSLERFYNLTSQLSYNPRSNMQTLYQAGTGAGTDYRWTAYFAPHKTSTSTQRFMKVVDTYQLNDQEFSRPKERIKGINLIRLPEMYYIAAEALVTTNPEKSRDYLDAVLKSRGLIGLKDRVPAVAASLDLITADRYKEFVGEGQTFFNMKRLNSNINSLQNTIIPASKAIYVLPIPLIEYDYRN